MTGKEEQRYALKFCVKLEYSATESYQMLIKAYGDDAMSRTQAFDWFKRFSTGLDTIKDAERPGRPSSSTEPGNVGVVEALVLGDRRVSIRQITKRVGISYGSVRHIVTEILGYKKVCAHWVPRLLNDVQRQNRVTICQQWKGLYRRHGDHFLNSIVTCDESWYHHYDPETKQQSMQWVRKGEPRPVKAKAIKSAGKVMHLVFFDITGVIYDHVIPKGTSVTGQYYSNVLKGPFMRKMRQKRQNLLRDGWWFHQDNAPAHTSRLAMETINNLDIQILPHPAYSPDLAPADFFLFPETKKLIKGRHFDNDDDLNNCVMGIFNSFSSKGFQHPFQKWVERWQKCIDSDGQFFEG